LINKLDLHANAISLYIYEFELVWIIKNVNFIRSRKWSIKNEIFN